MSKKEQVFLLFFMFLLFVIPTIGGICFDKIETEADPSFVRMTKGRQLHSYFFDDFSVSFILGGDVLPIQKESDNHKNRTEESEPVVRRE